VELSLVKMAGLVVLLLPMAPARLREWAYAGFAFTLASALVAHLAVGDGPAAWLWAVGTFGLEAVSYYFFRRGTFARVGTGERRADQRFLPPRAVLCLGPPTSSRRSNQLEAAHFGAQHLGLPGERAD